MCSALWQNTFIPCELAIVLIETMDAYPWHGNDLHITGPSRMDSALQWHHNEHDGVSNHWRLECLLKHLFRRRSKKTSKLRTTGLYIGNSPETGEFPAQRASNADNVPIWWRHHGTSGEDSPHKEPALLTFDNCWTNSRDASELRCPNVHVTSNIILCKCLIAESGFMRLLKKLACIYFMLACICSCVKKYIIYI